MLEIEDEGPVVRVFIGHDLHAGRFQARNGVRRRGLDKINLPGHQCGGAGRGLRHRQQHKLVVLRDAVLVPVVLVRQQLQPLMRHHAAEPVRAGAGGVRRISVPVVFQLFRPAAADHEQVAHGIGKQRFDHLGVDGDREVVDFLNGFEIGDVSARQRHLLGQILRRLGIRHPREVPQHVIGGERAAIVPFHALAQMEDPALLIGGINLPARRQARLDVRRLVGRGQIPQRQRVIEVVTDEAEPLEPLIGIAGGDRDIAGGHTDGQDAVGLGRSSRPDQTRGKRQGC